MLRLCLAARKVWIWQTLQKGVSLVSEILCVSFCHGADWDIRNAEIRLVHMHVIDNVNR